MKSNRVKEFKRTTLGELVTFQRGHDLPKNQRMCGNYPLVSSSGIIDLHNEYKAKGPGIVIGRSGSLGSSYYIRDDYWPLNTTLYSKQFHESNPKFVYYFIKTLKLENYNAGTSVPTLNRNHIHPIEISIPSTIEEQQKIAQILSNLDSQIECLHNQNKILEQIAQEIFKSWFVDFEGVTEFEDSELGQIPKGWKIKKIEEIVKKQKYSIVDGPFGTQMKISEYLSEGVPIIEMQYLEGGIFYKKFKNYISLEKFEEVKRSAIYDGDIIISKTGTLGLLGIMVKELEPAIIVSRLCKITPDETIISKYYIFMILKKLKDEHYWESISSGSTMPLFNLTAVKNIEIILPPLTLQKKFNSIAKKIYEKIQNNQKYILTLTETRDSLLPKLMSGEIRV